jgi:glucosamine--fructose-6-phosphate aminotransferase (isomerizing)
MTVVEAQILSELDQAPDAVRRQADALTEPIQALVASLRRKPPQVVVTCARGTSAHAATFGKHLIERYLNIPVAAAAPNIATVYHQRLQLADQLFLAISQSGRSDDLIEQATAARASGAVTACLVNETDSPLARACEFVLPMAAGPEHSVAATKTFVASLAALTQLIAAWTRDDVMVAALHRLPDRLTAARMLDWREAIESFAAAGSLITIGRGPTLAIAREAALKFKEMCNLHAEAFSGAEVLHGPVTLVSPHYPVLMLMPTDAAAPGMLQLARDLRDKAAAVFTTDPGETGARSLPVLTPEHPETDAIVLVQSFYRFAIRLAERRGIDVDNPRHLQKVTRTR